MTLKKIRIYSVLIATILVMSFILVACGIKLDPGNEENESGGDIPPTGITIKAPYDAEKEGNEYILLVDGTLLLTAELSPSNTTDKSLTWSIVNKISTTRYDTDDTHANVDKNGKVTGVSEGEVTVIATSVADDSISGSIDIKVVEDEPEVVPPVLPDSIEVNGETNLTVGDTAQFTATVNPSDADDKSVTWDTSNHDIATVTQDGKVTAVSPGLVDIIATSVVDENVFGSKSLTVEALPIDYIISIAALENPYLTIEDGTLELEYTVNPTDANIAWSSSDDEIATVDGGVVNAISTSDEGSNITITATIVDENGDAILDENDDEYSASIELTIFRDEMHIQILEFIARHQEWVDSFIDWNIHQLPTTNIDDFAQWYKDYNSFLDDYNDNFVNLENESGLVDMSQENAELLEGYYRGVNEASITEGLNDLIKHNVHQEIWYLIDGLPTFANGEGFPKLNGDFVDIITPYVNDLETKFEDIRTRQNNGELDNEQTKAKLNTLIDNDLKFLGYTGDYRIGDGMDSYYDFEIDYNNFDPNDNNLLLYWSNYEKIDNDIFMNEHYGNELEIVTDSLNKAVLDHELEILFGNQGSYSITFMQIVDQIGMDIEHFFIFGGIL